MPTGIEEVGLVLATWPIVIGALKFYAEEQGVSHHRPQETDKSVSY